MVLRKPNSHMQNSATGPLLYTIHKNQRKWVKDLNVRPKTIKLLVENIEDKLLDIGLDNDFLDFTTKVRQQK